MAALFGASPGLGSGGNNLPESHCLPGDALTDTLTIRDEQLGFAGSTGTVWVIEPGGIWYVANFLNETTFEPLRKGQLTSDQLADVTGLLGMKHFCNLPEHFGRNLDVNPHLFTISYGDKSSTLVLTGGELLTEEIIPVMNTMETEALSNFFQIFKNVLTLLNESD